MNKTIKKLTYVGALFVTIFGALFHFVFEWSGENKVVGALTPVNESVWEHLKLALIPILLFALVEWLVLRFQKKNIVFAKTVEIWLVIFLITSFFYTYTGIIGFNTLWADILLTFVIPVIIGKYLSYKLLSRENQPKNKIIPAISLLILLFAFIFFTFQPPKLLLFQDPEHGTYGICEEQCSNENPCVNTCCGCLSTDEARFCPIYCEFLPEKECKCVGQTCEDENSIKGSINIY